MDVQEAAEIGVTSHQGKERLLYGLSQSLQKGNESLFGDSKPLDKQWWAGYTEGLDTHNQGMVTEESSLVAARNQTSFKNRACSVHDATSPGESTGWKLLWARVLLVRKNL